LVAILLGIARQIAISGRLHFHKLFPFNDLRTTKPNRTILTRFRCPPYSSLQCITLESTRQDGKSVREQVTAVNSLVEF